ncbi:MAG: BON domain-containing protein, partial [Mesorhizobium sp.]
MSLVGKLPVIAAAAIGLFLIGTNAPGLVEAKAANRAAGVTASVASQRVKLGLNGEQIASLDLAVERDVAGLEDYLKRFLPTSQIKVELLNDNVILTGNVDTPLDAKRAVDLATIFVSGGEATTGQYS